MYYLTVPPDKFEFNLLTSEQQQQQQLSTSASTTDQNGPLLRCAVERVYPKPGLTFSELFTGNASPIPLPASMSSSFHSFPSIEVHHSHNDSTGLHSAWFEYRLAVDSIKVGTVYECKLELPSTSFVRKKRIKLIYPSRKFFLTSEYKIVKTQTHTCTHIGRYQWSSHTADVLSKCKFSTTSLSLSLYIYI